MLDKILRDSVLVGGKSLKQDSLKKYFVRSFMVNLKAVFSSISFPQTEHLLIVSLWNILFVFIIVLLLLSC